MKSTFESSPFHRGEQQLQHRMGVRERMEQFGRRVIRDHMPDQHRAFYQQLPFVMVGHADEGGRPWASMLLGEPGFIQSPNEKVLSIEAQPVKGDPLACSWKVGQKFGLLGIELHSRRRNRLNATVEESSEANVVLSVDQSFGNCPKYIQNRSLQMLDGVKLPEPEVEVIQALDDRARDLIRNSDTFFVASHVNTGSGEASDGADVSHRGGRSGFVRVDEDGTLVIPDYSGNNHFNTLGNFVENPRAGLLFADFENGHLLTLTGAVEIIWDSPEAEHFAGAERLWTFRVEEGRWLNHSLPWRWQLQEYSPFSLKTGTWQAAM
ncbi:flavin-nucleotide-binding protein [Pseudomaricurvus alkylphenolicus]|uniref:pyridoxamine 5'-phosphate oxidase family protein n=1 Tax=Pseudomaricurvus alkylphenolicus TaxID=1306991 RepID=UPI00141F038B|nr:pyridoxamine 5'-phosphate oxidase family protein [Pseudomaricurvus alkylphenolicus]NIB40963.1 flavin-nucleotide-binding protein [Pseudomaricurvus alkylphenolicus]